ncbi:MAG: hypothetical protein Q4F49_02960 [Pseudoxanthomonas suwonensis]|nr:hypothetical protein [Pseudoxanthomonas suwonensis]
MTRSTLFASTALALLTLASASTLHAQQPGKRLYCWNEGGRRVCGDALPAEAAARAREEFSATSGRRTGEVPRALNEDERAAAAARADAERAAEEAEAARVRRDLAMIESYATEADLRRAYGERTALVDASVKGSELGEANLRSSLVTALRQAADLELAGKPVPGPRVQNIRQLRHELDKQLRILEQQRADRVVLDTELADAVRRYRLLKGVPDAVAAPRVSAEPATDGG